MNVTDEEDFLAGFNLNETESTVEVCEVNSQALQHARINSGTKQMQQNPDDPSSITTTTTTTSNLVDDNQSEPETEYLDFSNISSLALADASFEDQSTEILSEMSTEMSEVFTLRRKSFNVRIRAKIAPECAVSSVTSSNGIRISISPRKTQVKSPPNGSSRTGDEKISVKSGFRETIMKELSQSSSTKKVLHYLESLSDVKKTQRDSTRVIKNERKPRRKTDVIRRNIEYVPYERRSSFSLPLKRSLKKIDMNSNKIRRSTSSGEYEDCVEDLNSVYATEGSTEWTESEQLHDPKPPPLDQPMIKITQELSTELVMTSRIDINKEKLKRMQAKKKIITDNVCNEILDQTISLRRSSEAPKKPPRVFSANTFSESQQSLNSLNLDLYEELRQLKLFEFNARSYNKSPRYEKPTYGWTPPEKDLSQMRTPTLPARVNQIGWLPEHQIYSMLHYSDDEKKKTVDFLGTRAQPQTKSYSNVQLFGPKLNIDDVDSPVKPSTSKSSIEAQQNYQFSCRLNCTKEICRRFLEMERSSDRTSKRSQETSTSTKPSNNEFLPSAEEFLGEERKEFSFMEMPSIRYHSKLSSAEKGYSSIRTTPSSGKKSDRIDRSAETVLVTEKFQPLRKFNSNAPLPQSPRTRFSFTTPKKSALKIMSPKRFLKSDSKTMYETYKSFEEPNQNIAATMKEVLKKLSCKIEGFQTQQPKLPTFTPQAPPRRNRKIIPLLNRRKSLSSEYEARHEVVKIDLHDEPSYAEVPELDNPSAIEEVSHVILNEDPNAIYATVKKKRVLSRSLESIEKQRFVLGSSRRRISFYNSQERIQDAAQVIKFIQHEREYCINSSNVGEKRENEAYQKQHDNKRQYEVEELSESGAYHAYSTIDKGFQYDKDVEEDIKSINFEYESNGGDSHNNEAGYDVIGFQNEIFDSNFYPDEEKKCIFVNQQTFHEIYYPQENRQITSLDSSFSDAPSPDLGLQTASKSSFVKPPLPERRHKVYKSFRKTLRSSFRKGRNFAQDRIITLFDKREQRVSEPKPARSFFSLDEYKRHYNDLNAEKIFENWQNRNSGDVVLPRELCKVELIGQIRAQREQKKELKNALKVCRTSKEFESSTELVEAERLLLISNLLEATAKKQLVELESSNYANLSHSTENGVNIKTITLSDFEIPLKDAAKHDTLYNYFYVCVCSYENQVKATYSKERSREERENQVVSFKNVEIKFCNIDADYQIKVEIFVLTLRKIHHGAPESRLQSIKNIAKFSPKKLFAGPHLPESPKSLKGLNTEFSEFKSQGFVYISSSSFNKIRDPSVQVSSNFQNCFKAAGDDFLYSVEDFRYFKMIQMLYNSHLKGDILMGIKCDVKFNKIEVHGFLNVAENSNGINWNRRWCKLDGLEIKFWNYPQESNTKAPLDTINLRDYLGDKIYEADRSSCPKPRCIEIILSKGTSPESHFLVADNKGELRMWLEQLNRTLQFIREWNV